MERYHGGAPASDVSAGPVDLHGRTVGAPDLPSLPDVSAAPDTQAVAGRGHLYAGGARVANDGLAHGARLLQ